MGIILFFEWLFVILIAIAVYVITAIGLYKIGARNGVKNSWLAFIPILQYYVVGSICEEYVLFGYRIKYLNWLMCIIMFFALMSGGSFSRTLSVLRQRFCHLCITQIFLSVQSAKGNGIHPAELTWRNPDCNYNLYIKGRPDGNVRRRISLPIRRKKIKKPCIRRLIPKKYRRMQGFFYAEY